MMSELSHARGPWTCRVEKPFIPEAGGVVMIDAPGWLGIAKVYLHCTGGTEGEANARLIAAAPDLLAACEEAAECLEDDESKWAQRVREKMLAAILKAKGTVPS